MNPPLETRPRQQRYSIHCQARLAAETSAKLEALTRTSHRKRAAILRSVMQWGLARTEGWTVDPSVPDRPHLVHLLMDPELLQRVQDAADGHEVSVAAWLRHAMRQVTPEGVPPSWRVAETAVRSHDSGHYGRRFMLRLDDKTSSKLEELTQTFQRSAAEVIRQLIVQAKPEEFPPNWQLAVGEHRQEGDVCTL